MPIDFLPLNYKSRQGHGIFRVHPPHRGTAVSGSEHLARTGHEKFTGLDEFSSLIPPGAEKLALFTGHAPGDGKSQFSSHFSRFFLRIHATRNNAHTEFRQDLALFFEAGQLPATERSPVTAIKQDERIRRIDIRRQAQLAAPGDVQFDIGKLPALINFITHTRRSFQTLEYIIPLMIEPEISNIFKTLSYN